MPTSPNQCVQPDSDADTGRQGLLEVAFESLPCGLVVFDKRLNLIFQNQTARSLLPDEPDISRMLSELAEDSTYEDWASELRRVVESGLPRRQDVVVKQVGDTPETYLDILLSQLRHPETGDALGGLLLVEDVTSRASMERRLAVSERLAAVGKMAARVAHELNNPLDGILRYTKLAMRVAQQLHETHSPKSDEASSKIVAHLEHAKSGAVRMAEILADMLKFSRNAPAAFEQATINKIVEDAVAALEGQATDAGVSVVCNFLQTDMPVVRGSNLFQVFCNLTKNAIDAMPDGGTLTITTQLQPPDVVIMFEDTGIGLPEEADKIFEPFFTTKAPGKGTGLGLAVCKELIDKYSGAITASNREPQGTRMTVRIPVRNLEPFTRSAKAQNHQGVAADAPVGRQEWPEPGNRKTDTSSAKEQPS
ncbi:MAG: ATP-binding protein [Planctomycetota bacterium]